MPGWSPTSSIPTTPTSRSDAVFGVKESLLARFDKITDSKAIASAGFDKPFFMVEHDFILAPT